MRKEMSASEVNWIHTWITGEPNSWFRNMADMEFWPSEIPKFEDAKPILEKFS